METKVETLPLREALEAAAANPTLVVLPADRSVLFQEETEETPWIGEPRSPGTEPNMVVISPAPNTPSR